MTLTSTSRFRIGFEWTRRTKQYDDMDTGATTPLHAAARSFVYAYEGNFSMYLDDTEVEFVLEWDLPIVFEFLAAKLEGILREENVPHVISFSGQGTAVVVVVVRHGRELSLEIEPFGDPPEYYYQFFDKQFVIRAEEFIHEWAKFLSAVLDAILDLEPSTKNDAQVRDYIARFDALRSASIPGEVDQTP